MVKTIGTDGTIIYTSITETQLEAGKTEAISRSMGIGFSDGPTAPKDVQLSLFAENRTPENVEAVEAAINGAA